MADYSIPLQGQQPNMLGAMGNLVNTAQGIQNFQTGALQQQRLGINLQSEQQANQERKNVIQAIQNQDPDLTPGPDGIIDSARATAKLQQLAPQTYNAYAQNISTTNQAATQVNKQLMDLGQDKLQALGEVVTSKVGRPASEVADAVNDWAQANPQGKKVADLFIQNLGKADSQVKVDALTKAAALRANTIGSQLEATTAGLSIVGQGPQSQAFVTAPKLSGQPLMGTVGQPIPMGTAPGYQVDSAGNLVAVPGFMPKNGQRTPGPTGAPPPAAGGALPAPPAWMNRQQAQNATDAQARWSSSQARDVDPNSGYAATSQVYKNLKNLFDQNPNLGPGSAQANQFIGRVSTMTGQRIPDLNTAYQEAASYLDRLSMQTGAASGAANKFQDEQAARAVGSPEVMGPPAIQEKLRFGSSVNEAAHAYTKASQAFLTKQGPNAAYANPQMFEGAWSENADPIAFRLMAAKNNGDTADYKATLARATPDTLRHYQNLQTLMSGKLPTQ